MGHKVHPYGFRIGIIKPWLAKWYADRDYATLLQEDVVAWLNAQIGLHFFAQGNPAFTIDGCFHH